MKKTLLISAVAFITILGVNAQKLYTFGTDVETDKRQAYNVSITLSNGAVLNSSGSTNTANAVWIEPAETGKWEITGGIQIDSHVGRISLKDSQNSTRIANVAVEVQSGQVIEVLFASSGDASRTLGVSLNGTEVATFASSATKNVYLSGKYTATASGTLTLYSKGSGMYLGVIGVGVAVPQTTSVKSVLADKGVTFNGKEILNNNNLSLEVYNVLGKRVMNSTGNISVEALQKGVYFVRAAGVNDVLKFSK